MHLFAVSERHLCKDAGVFTWQVWNLCHKVFREMRLTLPHPPPILGFSSSSGVSSTSILPSARPQVQFLQAFFVVLTPQSAAATGENFQHHPIGVLNAGRLSQFHSLQDQTDLHQLLCVGLATRSPCGTYFGGLPTCNSRPLLVLLGQQIVLIHELVILCRHGPAWCSFWLQFDGCGSCLPRWLGSFDLQVHFAFVRPSTHSLRLQSCR